VQLVFNIFNLCAPDPPKLGLQSTEYRGTDGRTDDMQSQYCALHSSASHGKKTIQIDRLLFELGPKWI